MIWKRVKIETTHEASELIADILSFDENCVVIEDINDYQNILDDDKFGVLNNESLDRQLKEAEDVVYCIGHYSLDDFDNTLDYIKNEIKKLKENSSFNLGGLSIFIDEVEDVNWLEEWKKYYQIMQYGKFVIVPSWEEYLCNKTQICIYIEPGLAFGTGDHESTKLALKIMNHIDFNNMDVLDMGTGSGILGIGAKKAGAKKVFLFDNDSKVKTNIEENLKINNITQGVEVKITSNPEDTNIKLDVIIANITADILMSLKDQFALMLKKNAKLILSGIIIDKLHQVEESYLQSNFDIIKEEIEGDWVALLLRNNNGN